MLFENDHEIGAFQVSKIRSKIWFSAYMDIGSSSIYVSEFTLTPNFYIDGSTSNCTDWATGCNKIFLVFPSKAIEGGGLGSGVKNHEDLIWL